MASLDIHSGRDGYEMLFINWWRINLFSFRVMNMVKLFTKAFWRRELNSNLKTHGN